MLVSIVTPTLNSVEYIRQSIASVQMQSSPRVEVEHIVVDGGSTDGTVDVARELGCTVITGHDQGIFDATNIGTRASKGHLVGFLGADDLLMPGALEAIVRRYEASSCRWVTGAFRHSDGDLRSQGDVAAPPKWLSAELMASLGWCYIMHMATYVERGLFDEIGGFDPSWKYAGDYKFFSRALQIANFAREPAVITVFRRHGGNMSMSATPRYFEETTMVADEFGPRQRWKRELYRWFMKVWVNGRNPRWFAAKHR